MKVKINLKDLFLTVSVLTFYRMLLDYTYSSFISPTFFYMGHIFIPNIGKGIFSYFMMYVLFLCIPQKHSKYGQFLNLFFSFSIVPLLSFYWLADKDTNSMVLSCLFFLIMTLSFRNSSKPIVLKKSINYIKIIELIFYFYIFACIYLGIKRGGIDMRSLNLGSIYSLRSEYNGTGTISGYLLNWCTKAFFPTLTTYYLFTNHKFKVLIAILMQFFLFMCYGSKAYLLSIFLLVVIYYLIKHVTKYPSYINMLIQSFFGLLLIPIFFTKYNNILGKLGVLFRDVYGLRMFFEPSRIKFGYFSFFNYYPKLYFSEGIIGKLLNLHYPYDKPIGFIITKFMDGSKAVSNSNTGIISDSYAQLGIFGIILIAFLTATTFYFIVGVTNNLPNYFVLSALVNPIALLNDNAFLTNILTHGWFIIIIMFLLFEGALNSKISGVNNIVIE